MFRFSGGFIWNMATRLPWDPETNSSHLYHWGWKKEFTGTFGAQPPLAGVSCLVLLQVDSLGFLSTNQPFGAEILRTRNLENREPL